MALSKQDFAKRANARTRSLEISANSVNLPDFLSARGFDVKQTSSNGDFSLKGTSAGNFGLRFNGEVWLAYQNGSDGFAGNAVQLMQYIHGYDKKDAISDIVGEFKLNTSMTNNSKAIAQKAVKDSTVQTVKQHTSNDIAVGRLYLASRGIDAATFEALRKDGSAEYAWNGVSFIGKRADGKPGLIETRLFKPLERKDKPGKFTNHLVSGQRSCPVVIQGTVGCKEVDIVEGNFDGLALCEMNQRNLAADQQPTIIISGGKDNLKLLDNDAIVATLKAATAIKCYGDNERIKIDELDDPRLFPEALADKQALSDASHQKRIDAIRVINPTATIEYILPPADIDDLADWNKRVKATLPKPAKVFKF